MLVFVDESGDAGMKLDEGSSEFFVVTAVLFEENDAANDCAERINLIPESNSGDTIHNYDHSSTFS